MTETGVDSPNNPPKILTDEAILESDVVITMGCGDACPIFPEYCITLRRRIARSGAPHC